MVQTWKQWCRLCGTENNDNNHVEIFPSAGEISQLCAVICKCFSINIGVQDGLPQTICMRCHQFIETIINFSQQVNKVQAMYWDFAKSMEDLDSVADVDLKDFAINGESEIIECKPKINLDLSDQIVDHTQPVLYNSMNVKTENAGEDTFSVHDRGWEAEGHLSSSSYESYDDLPLEEERTSNDLGNTLAKRSRGRPKKPDSVEKKMESGNFTCTDCDKSFSLNSTYRHHMQSAHGLHHQKAKQFPCTECDRILTTARRLRNHAILHLAPNEMPTIPCPYCGEKFSEIGLKSHAITHLPPGEKPSISCPYCDERFPEIGLVHGHVNSVHPDQTPFICEICGKICKTIGTLRFHKIAHTEGKLFKCSWCDRPFTSKRRLNNHMVAHVETDHICSICGVHLKSRRTLKMHLIVHSDQRLYKCDFCGKGYKRAKGLKNHLLTHAGIRPYTCNFCERTFSNGSNCRTHQRKVHPEELAILEATGGKSMSAANIPKLQHLMAVTASKAGILQSLVAEPLLSENLVSLPQSVEENPPSLGESLTN